MLKERECFNVKVIFKNRIPDHIKKTNDLSNSAKLLWRILADHIGPKGCFPSRDRLQREMGISVRQIDRLLKELEGKNYILRITPLHKDRSSHKTTRYYFLWKPEFSVGIKITEEQYNNAKIPLPVDISSRHICQVAVDIDDRRILSLLHKNNIESKLYYFCAPPQGARKFLSQTGEDSSEEKELSLLPVSAPADARKGSGVTPRQKYSIDEYVEACLNFYQKKFKEKFHSPPASFPCDRKIVRSIIASNYDTCDNWGEIVIKVVAHAVLGKAERILGEGVVPSLSHLFSAKCFNAVLSHYLDNNRDEASDVYNDNIYLGEPLATYKFKTKPV